jgi:RecA-family ATPase
MQGKINAMLGPEKSGKSRLLCWMFAAMYSGLGHSLTKIVTPTRVPKRMLYLAGEETQATVTRRIIRYIRLQVGRDADPGFVPIDIIEASGMRLETTEHRKHLEALLVEGEYDCLVIDPLRRVHAGDEDSNTTMAQLNNDFRYWSNKLGITLIIVHHTGKLNDDADMGRMATWARGATDFAAILDTAVFVQQIGNATSKARRMKVTTVGRFPPCDPMTVEDCTDMEGFKRGFDA